MAERDIIARQRQPEPAPSTLDSDLRIQLDPLRYLHGLPGKQDSVRLTGLGITILVSRDFEPTGYLKPPLVTVSICSTGGEREHWLEDYVIDETGLVITSHMGDKTPFVIPFGQMPSSEEVGWKSRRHWWAAQIALFIKHRKEIKPNPEALNY